MSDKPSDDLRVRLERNQRYKDVWYLSCGEATVTVEKDRYFSTGNAEGSDALVPLSDLDDVRRCLDRLREILDEEKTNDNANR